MRARLSWPKMMYARFERFAGSSYNAKLPAGSTLAGRQSQIFGVVDPGGICAALRRIRAVLRRKLCPA